jgi:hypothetical protein
MYKDFPHREDMMRTLHNIQEDTTIEYMGINIPIIYVTLKDRKVENQSHTISILIDSRSIHSYIDPKVVDTFHLKKNNHEKSNLVQLATRTKRRINETAKNYPINLNGVSTNTDMNIIPLGYYDILIGMDWLDKHHAILDCHNMTFTCLDEEGK